MIAHSKKQPAKAGLDSGRGTSPRAPCDFTLERLTILREMLPRLIAQATAARTVNIERAGALDDAVRDLKVMIARLESALAAPATRPQVGDLLIKGVTTELFQIIEITTGEILAGPIHGFPAALAAARARQQAAIWQQHTDERGRPLSEPFRLPTI